MGLPRHGKAIADFNIKIDRRLDRNNLIIARSLFKKKPLQDKLLKRLAKNPNDQTLITTGSTIGRRLVLPKRN